MANKVVLFVTLALLATLVAADATGKLWNLLQHLIEFMDELSGLPSTHAAITCLCCFD